MGQVIVELHLLHAVQHPPFHDVNINTEVYSALAPVLRMLLCSLIVPAMRSSSSYGFLIYDQILWYGVGWAATNRKPGDGVLVVERPGWDDD